MGCGTSNKMYFQDGRQGHGFDPGFPEEDEFGNIIGEAPSKPKGAWGEDKAKADKAKADADAKAKADAAKKSDEMQAVPIEDDDTPVVAAVAGGAVAAATGGAVAAKMGADAEAERQRRQAALAKAEADEEAARAKKRAEQQAEMGRRASFAIEVEEKNALCAANASEAFDDLKMELGCSFLEGPEDGTRISDVFEDKAAERGGLMDDDIVKSINLDPTPDKDDFKRVVMRYNPGDTIPFRVRRGGDSGEEFDVPVTLGAKNTSWAKLDEIRRVARGDVVQSDWPVWGTCETFADEQERKKKKMVEEANKAFDALKLELGCHFIDGPAHGTAITDVMEGRAADKGGLQDDDIVATVNGTATPEKDSFKTAVLACKPGQKVAVGIYRIVGGVEGQSKLMITMGAKEKTIPEVREIVRKKAGAIYASDLK